MCPAICTARVPCPLHLLPASPCHTPLCSVLRAHPVRELAAEDGRTDVEMDSEDEWHVRQQIQAAGLR